LHDYPVLYDCLHYPVLAHETADARQDSLSFMQRHSNPAHLL
jgi:hypothetical protein